MLELVLASAARIATPRRQEITLVRRGVAGYRGGAGGKAWEAAAGKLAASAGCFAGLRWLAAGAFAAGAAEAVGEKPLERVCPLIGNKCTHKSYLVKSRRGYDRGLFRLTPEIELT